MKNQGKEPPMKATTKLVGGFIALVILLPVLAHWLSELLLPTMALVVLLLIARIVWFHTRM
jgi:hypothetical protein